MKDDAGETEEESCLMASQQQKGMRRLSVRGQEKAVWKFRGFPECRVSISGRMNPQARKAAHL